MSRQDERFGCIWPLLFLIFGLGWYSLWDYQHQTTEESQRQVKQLLALDDQRVEEISRLSKELQEQKDCNRSLQFENNVLRGVKP